MKKFILKLYCFIIVFLPNIYSLIVIPFRISGFNPIQKWDYNVTDFVKEYLFLDIFTTVEIGTPPQQVATLISPDEKTFSLSAEICKRKSLKNIYDVSIVKKTGYKLDYLNLYYIDLYKSIIVNYINEDGNVSNITEKIYLYNTTYLSNQPKDWGSMKGDLDTKIKVPNMTFIIKDYKYGEPLCGSLGIGSPIRLTAGLLKLKDMPSFIDTLKNNKVIDNYSWTIKIHHSEEGRLVIGDLPHIYEYDKKFYNESKYKTFKSFEPHNVDYPWSIRFDSINFVNSKNETLYIQEGLRSYLVPNYGFIIGEENYRNLILENYFQDLINKKICVLEKTEKTNITRTYYHFATNGIYEVFHCNKSILDEKEKFPKLNFEHKEQNIIFSLNFSDLFMLIQERYFFLVIFPENFWKVKSSFWYLGLPFYKAYQFVFNFDSKTISTYEKPIIHTIIDNDTIIDEPDSNSEKKGFNFTRTLLEIIFGIILVLIAYFIGKKINEQRKKRANELADDYEYHTENDTNDINNSQNNNIIN